MKVMYDISVLGLGHYHSYSSRTGIFRVIETLAQHLVLSPEHELFFCASESLHALNACLDYLKSNRRLSKVPLSYSSHAQIFYTKLIDLKIMLENQAKVKNSVNENSTYKAFAKDLDSALNELIKTMGNYPELIE